MNNNFNIGIGLSAALHIGVVVWLYMGLPHIAPQTSDMWKPIPIEVVPISEITTAQAPEIEEIKEEEPEEDKPEKEMPPESEPVEAENPTSSAQEPVAEQAVEEEIKPIPVPPEHRPEVKPASIPEPRQKPKQLQAKIPTPAKRTDKPKEKQDEFASVLKNLQKNVGKTPKATSKGTAKKQPTGTISDVLTVSELDALRQQISQCWNIPVGAQNIENLVIDVRVSMNPDRTVKRAHIIDKSLAGRALNYRTAAESALRAVLHPNCSPLKLPANKFDEWKEFTFRFNPKDFV